MSTFLEVLVAGMGGAAQEAQRLGAEEISMLRKQSLAAAAAANKPPDPKNTAAAVDSQELLNFASSNPELLPAAEQLSSIIQEHGIEVAMNTRVWDALTKAYADDVGTRFTAGAGTTRIKAGDSARAGIFRRQIEEAYEMGGGAARTAAVHAEQQVQNARAQIDAGVPQAQQQLSDADPNTSAAAQSVVDAASRVDPAYGQFMQGRIDEMGATAFMALPEIQGFVNSLERGAGVRADSAMGTPRIEGENEADRVDAELRAALGMGTGEAQGQLDASEEEAFRRELGRSLFDGDSVLLSDPNNPSSTISVRRDDARYDEMLERGWQPHNITTYTGDNDRQHVRDNNTGNVWVVAPEHPKADENGLVTSRDFYGRGHTPTPLASPAVRAADEAGDIIFEEESRTDRIMSPDFQPNAALSSIGYRHLDLQDLPDFDMIGAGQGLDRVYANTGRLPVVGPLVRKLREQGLTDEAVRVLFEYRRLDNIVRNVNVINKSRPGTWEQGLSLELTGTSGVLASEVSAVESLRVLHEAAERGARRAEQILATDPMLTSAERKDLRDGIRDSYTIMATTERFLASRELNTESVALPTERGNERRVPIGRMGQQEIELALEVLEERKNEGDSIDPRLVNLLTVRQLQLENSQVRLGGRL